MLLNWLGAAHWTAAKELPGLLRQIMAQFPELRANPALALPLGDPKVAARGTGKAAQAEAQANTRAREPMEGQERKELAVQPGPPEPDAVTIAGALRRAIRLRFAVPKGGVEVVAPGHLAISFDVSESMWYTKGKIWAARVAAQAIALAMRDAGGDVVGVLFDDTAARPARAEPLLIGAGWGDALLFAPAAWPTEGGTTFAFLSDLWRRYPNHWVVLVTDGDAATCPTRRRPTGRAPGRW